MRRGLGSGNGSKETSCASADHDNLEMGITEHAALTPKERLNAKKNARRKRLACDGMESGFIGNS
jgi:hypothetical protein